LVDTGCSGGSGSGLLPCGKRMSNNRIYKTGAEFLYYNHIIAAFYEVRESWDNKLLRIEVVILLMKSSWALNWLFKQTDFYSILIPEGIFYKTFML